MALKKPLVITSGRIQQLQSGDTIEGAGSETYTVTNLQGSTITICQAVYFSGDDEVSLARADVLGTARVRGLVSDTSILDAATGDIRLAGVMEATTGQWDAVTGDTGGLLAQTRYFLSDITAGALTRTAPSTREYVVAPIGIALSATKMELRFEPLVLL